MGWIYVQDFNSQRFALIEIIGSYKCTQKHLFYIF